MKCPEFRVRPEGRYEVNKFITPEAFEIIRQVRKLKLKDWGENIIEACFNFVSLEVVYKKDKKSYGHEEYWRFPRETLQRKSGDCEDTSFLLASLLLASGLQDEEVRVVLGKVDDRGHAWVEVL